MNTFDWAKVREDAIRHFQGDTPRAELEQRIIDVFEQQPELVVKTISIVTDGFQAGRVRSPWAILDLNLKEAGRPVALVTATDTTSKARAVMRAEQWLRAAGLHFDRESEVAGHLFGDRGLLRPYAQVDEIEVGRTDRDRPIPGWSEPRGDLALVERMLGLWREQRQVGLELEDDAVERAEAWKVQKAAVDEAKVSVLADLDARQPALEVGEDLVVRAERQAVEA